MFLSQQKAKTAAFTNALKQVFYIHKNVVAELLAKIDIISDECKLLKSSSSGKCKSCVHLTEKNKSLQEYFNRLLHEKDKGIIALEAKIQALTGEADSGSLHKQQGRTLPKETPCGLVKEIEAVSVQDQEFVSKNSGIKQCPLTKCKDSALPQEISEQEETGILNETELNKGHPRLSLTRQGKRHSRYLEEQQERKRVKISSLTVEREISASNGKVWSNDNSALACNNVVLVPDTVCTTQQRDSYKPTLQFIYKEKNKNDESESDDDQSQHIFVVPETLALESLNSDYEDDVKFNKNYSNNESQEELISYNDRQFDHSSIDESFFNDITGKNKKENMHRVSVNNVKDNCVSILQESSLDDDADVSNDENETVCLGSRQSGSERKIKCDSGMELFFHNETAECALRQSSSEKKDDYREVIQKKGALQNSVNLKETEGICKVKHGSFSLRKNSSVSVRQPDENALDAKLVRQTTLTQAFFDNDRLVNTTEMKNNNKKEVTTNVEELEIAEAVRRSLKDIHNNIIDQAKSEEIKLRSELQDHHHCSELKSAKSKYALQNSPQKELQEIISYRSENSLPVSDLLPVTSLALSELSCWNHQEAVNVIKSPDNRKQLLNSSDVNISRRVHPEPNGSLNPDIHLSEYINSEMMTEKQNQTFGALDETIAPNLVSQYELHQNADTSLLSRLSVLEKTANLTSQTRGSTDKFETSDVLETSTNFLDTVTRTPSKRLNVNYRESMNESKLEANNEWSEDDDLDNSVFSSADDDQETIKPSPQPNFQNGSLLFGSIPSTSCSFKFIHKRPHLAGKSVMQETGKTSHKMAIVDAEIGNVEENMDVNRCLFNDNPGPDHNTMQDIIQDPPQSLLDSFDRVPKLAEPEIPHVSVVRKKSERNKLQGFSCKQCYEYYKNSGLSDEAMQKKKNECSRHRERYQAPETPEHFWSLGFPDTAEMIERRQKYDPDGSPVTANRAPRRRRPLEKKF